jgi:hypothetical protein
MAIYTWLCKCGEIAETAQSISAYSDPTTKSVPVHCGVSMERYLTVNGNNAALANALAGDRHYDGLVAPDGKTLINSRTKHREYMIRNGLTIAEDFKGEWAKAAEQRQKRLNGDRDADPARRKMLEREFERRIHGN